MVALQFTCCGWVRYSLRLAGGVATICCTLSLHLAIVLPGAAVGFVLRLGIVFKGLARVSARLQQVVEVAFGIVERGNGFGLRHTIGEKPAQD